MGAPVRTALSVLAIVSAGQTWAQFDPTAPPPMATLATAPSPPNSPRLAWLRVDGRHSVAWYGGTTVRLGETVDNGRLVAVHEDHIVIAGSQGRRVVHLIDPALTAQQSKDLR